MKTTTIPQNTDVGTLVSKACAEVHGFDEMYRRLERRMNKQRRSDVPKQNVSLHTFEGKSITKPFILAR